MNKVKMISTTQFQRKVLELVREVEGSDNEFLIIRKSRPAAVLIGYDVYNKLKDQSKEASELISSATV